MNPYRCNHTTSRELNTGKVCRGICTNRKVRRFTSARSLEQWDTTLQGEIYVICSTSDKIFFYYSLCKTSITICFCLHIGHPNHRRLEVVLLPEFSENFPQKFTIRKMLENKSYNFGKKLSATYQISLNSISSDHVLLYLSPYP